jgi:calcineurin-like phosphoesterase family protein
MRKQTPIRRRSPLANILGDLLLLTFATGGQTILSAQGDIKVGIIGDQTMSLDLTASYQVLAEGAKALTAQHVDAVVHIGDLVESGGTVDQIRAEFSQATGILGAIGKPWHLAPGDHDVNPPQFQPDSRDDSRKRLYYDLYHSHEPSLSDGLWHSFDVRNYHFVNLNSQERFDVDPRWGDVFLSRISEEQLQWLKRDLEAHRRSKGIVIFLHQPLWYNWAWWAPIHAALRSYPVVAVIAGHFHYNQDEGEIDHIRYLVLGATGASVKRADRTSGGVHEVAVLGLRNGKAEVKLLPLDGGGPLQFTTRMDMDRVQALDLILGELYHFRDKNQLCLKDGHIFGPSGTPPRLLLIPAGNPIDLPLHLSISAPPDSKFSLDGPQFSDGSCQNKSPAGDCILAPSSRVETSNNSLVVLNDHDYSPLAPIWQSGISVRQGFTAQAGDAIRLTVKLAFASGQQAHSIEGVATTTLVACSAAGN